MLNIGSLFYEIVGNSKPKLTEEDINGVNTSARNQEIEQYLLSLPKRPVIKYPEHMAYSCGYYDWNDNSIILREIDRYKSVDIYYLVLFHEIGHHVGFTRGEYTKNEYWFNPTKKYTEELTADLVAIILGSKFGLDIELSIRLAKMRIHEGNLIHEHFKKSYHAAKSRIAWLEGKT